MSNETLDSFEIGDTVTLKSGGPDMTISSKQDGYIQCTYWHTVDKRFAEASLDPRTLRKI